MSKPDKNRRILYWCTLGLSGLTVLLYLFYIQFQTSLDIQQHHLEESLKLNHVKLAENGRQTPENHFDNLKSVTASGVYQSIETCAHDAQMTIYRFSVSQVSQLESQSNALLVDLTIDGSYQDFFRFLVNLQRDSGFFEMLNCSMTPSNLRKTAVNITLKLRFRLDGGVQ
jgi:hypothetical protein